MSEEWFVRIKDDALMECNPLTWDEVYTMREAGRLTATDLVKRPGVSDWQEARTIKDLFRDRNDLRFQAAELQMKRSINQPDRNSKIEALHEAVVVLSEIIEDEASSSWTKPPVVGRFRNPLQDQAGPLWDKKRAFWLRGECQGRVAWLTVDLTEVITIFESAQRDFSQSVKVCPKWYASKIAARWYPEHPMYLPAYHYFLASTLPNLVGEEVYVSESATALESMGRQAVEAIPSLEAAISRAGIFKHGVQGAIQRMSGLSKIKPANVLGTLCNRVERGLQSYSGFSEQFDIYNPPTVDEVSRSEAELVALLEDKEWGVRAKSACILRCTVDSPKQATIRALFEHLGSKEKRGNVRGQCVLGLGHFALNGVIKGEMLDHLVNVLRKLLESDRAYPVQGIAAKTLARISPDDPSIVPTLVGALSKPQLKVDLQRDLVKALGNCGSNASEALPLMLQFRPHHDDGTGELVKAVAIAQIVPSGHPEFQKALDKIVENLRWQPIGSSGSFPRKCRNAALTAILRVPIDGTRRMKLLLERMIFDESARIRCRSAQALIDIDKEFAKDAGAYLVLDSIRCM